MFGLLKSVAGVAGDLVKVAAAPVEVVVEGTRAITKPMAKVAQDLAQDVKDALK